jgi:hypothetical protein
MRFAFLRGNIRVRDCNGADREILIRGLQSCPLYFCVYIRFRVSLVDNRLRSHCRERQSLGILNTPKSTARVPTYPSLFNPVATQTLDHVAFLPALFCSHSGRSMTTPFLRLVAVFL